MSRKKTRSKVRAKNASRRTSPQSHKKRPSQKKHKAAQPRQGVQQKQDRVEPTDDNKPTVLLLFNKPFQVLCQFTDADDRDTLANYIKQPDLYAAGRLDRDSEGLLLLTNSGMLQHRISHPNFKMEKTYLVQVEGDVSNKALSQLRDGVKLNDGMTAPAQARRTESPEWLWQRDPPIRFRKDKPTSWIEIVLTEGRNRQIRRMTAAVGYPTLRLIRTQIGQYSISTLQPGEYVEVPGSAL